MTNLESRRRQYDLVGVARQREFVDVEIIGDDLGRSAGGTVARPGFDRLVAWLCAGKVGAVLCFDAPSGVIVTSTRGRWAGSAPRLVRRLSPRVRAAAGSFLSSGASLPATACSISSKASICSGSSFSERRPNCARLPQEMPQAVDLRQCLVALRGRDVTRRRDQRVRRFNVGWN
jgi:hypothetical protein